MITLTGYGTETYTFSEETLRKIVVDDLGWESLEMFLDDYTFDDTDACLRRLPSTYHKLNGFDFTVNEKIKQLMEKELVTVRVYADDGNVPATPFLEFQTDLEKTEVDETEYIGRVYGLDPAREHAKVIAEHFNVPCQL